MENPSSGLPPPEQPPDEWDEMSSINKLPSAPRGLARRMHYWTAEVAALDALVDALAPWEVVQQAAHTAVVPLSAVVATWTGWKVVRAAAPRLWEVLRRLGEYCGFHIDVRVGIGFRLGRRYDYAAPSSDPNFAGRPDFSGSPSSSARSPHAN